MSSIITGVVTNGVVVPAASLPEGAHVEIHVAKETAVATRLSASELRKLPRVQRQAIFAASAAEAEELYRTDKDLRGFDAFSEEIDDDSDAG